MRSHILIQVTTSMLTFLWAMVQRLFCCRRARRPSKGHGGKDEWSEEEGEAMLTSVTVDNSSGVDNAAQLENWNTWSDEDYREPTVADRIEAYRASLKKQNSIPDEVTENVDFFTDMTPSVSRQARVYVGPKTAPTNRLGVLEATDDLEDSLGTWNESSGWDAEDDGLTQIMREQRRQQKGLNSK